MDEATVVEQVGDAIRDGFPIGKRERIRDIDGRLLPFGLPLLAVVFEVADQLFLLAIDGNDGLAFGFKGFASAVDGLKWAVSVGMRGSFSPLLVGFERKSHRFSHPADGGLANRVSLAAEGLPQLAYRLARPSEQALRISLRLPHCLPISSEPHVLLGSFLPSASWLT